MSTTLLALCVICAACAHPAPAAAPSAPAATTAAWPVPAGWRSESFAFPLEFATSIPHQGREDLRFPPGFAKAGAPDFWSYDFVWWLDDAGAVDATTLSSELVAYFDGLATAADAETHKLPTARSPAVAILRTDLSGDVTIWDAFTTGAQVTLHAHITVHRCGARRAVVFALSPAAPDAAIWRDLDGLAAQVPCAP